MEELLNHLLRYGMFLGAIFQLVCIAAVIILPEHNKPHRESGQCEFTDSESDSSNIHTLKKLQVHHRTRKQDKKKRR